MTSPHVLPLCLPSLYAAYTIPLTLRAGRSLLQFPLDKSPNEGLDVNRRFDLADTSSGGEEPLRPPGSNTDVFLPNKSTRSNGRNSIVLQLHPLLQTQDHDCIIARERDILHPPDLYPSDLDRCADTQAGHAGEHRSQVIGMTATDLELAKTYREIPQGTQTQDDKQTNCDLKVEPPHGAFLMPGPRIMLV